ncbi:hypothetical protein CMV_007424 [Castanea mollissima]|uniref:Uncharacterized protein n=1 Tax=Castanea mollissima TaxID=60419 RepID=A0A8J4VQ89_9ROSI|nr:hypothetical protein CMV_007424 [Castanea mollissima]
MNSAKKVNHLLKGHSLQSDWWTSKKTITGYWGGVLPSSETMNKYNPKIAYPIHSPGSGVGGWVSLTRFYEEALEQSIARNFKYNNLICCMI